LIGTRYNDHEDCLDRFSNLFSEDIKRFEAIYDLLLVTVGTVLLVEAKTIRNDDRIQVRTAVGQLYYYDYFEVRPLYPAHNTKRLLVTDGPLANDISEFLTTLDIGVIWIERDGSRGGSDLGLAHLEQFGVGE